jgi:hypothetical protein
MLSCQIPAFGLWNYCSDLPITQYFDLAMQARLLKRGNRRRCCSGAGDEEDHGSRSSRGERRLVLFSASSPSTPRKPTQIKVTHERTIWFYLQVCKLHVYFGSSS